MTPASVESSRARVLSLLSFHKYSDPLRDFVLLLPQMGNEMDALLAILLLKPLLECFWVFNNPVKVPSVDLSSNFQNSKSSFLYCACLHTFSTPSWRSIFSSFMEHSTVLSSCALMHFTRCPPGRALRILNDSSLLSNSQHSSSFSVHPSHPLNAHLAELLQNPQ